jgi:hypothetical protein
MVVADFVVGKSYTWETIEKCENVTEDADFGPCICDKNAIYVSDGKLDVWFIYEGYNDHGGIYKCVYSN